jgi:L-2,4-diaminobutyrate decarboxylase
MTFTDDARRVTDALASYATAARERRSPVIRQEPLARLIEDLDLERLVVEGGLTGERLSRFMERYLSATTRLLHPRYLAHQVAVAHSTGSLASLVDVFTNNAMAIYEMGPPAAAIEFFLINRLLAAVGWRQATPGSTSAGTAPSGGGVLTHGGSLANLTALVAARTRIAPEVWRDGNPGDLAVMAPAEAHYSVARAVGILGMGSRSVYPLASDENGVAMPDRLPETLRRMRREGKRVVALVANACSTAAGLYDPVAEIGSFCRENDIWFHVDGAHGAAALLSERYRHLLEGVEQADSLTWDAHKLMRTPTLCAALLVRDGRTLDNAFQQEASYIFHDKNQPGVDFIHRTVECTKAGLGLKWFAVLSSMGERGVADYVESRFELAREAYRYLSGLPHFECPSAPEANILCFRLSGGDRQQIAVRDRLIEEGDFYISTTVFRGRRHLRLVFMNPDTDMSDVRALAERILTMRSEGIEGRTVGR